MSTAHREPLVSLYVPGDRPERFAKAVAAGADEVIIDLEDAVGIDRKDFARAAVAEFLTPPTSPEPVKGPISVRPNAAGTPWQEADLRMLAQAAGLSGVRLPKTADAAAIDSVREMINNDDVMISCLLETALGVERAHEIASHPQVSSIGLGEADLRAELGITAESGLDWIRVRTVVAARAAGLPAPMMAVYPHVRDLEGLERSCRTGAGLGFVGRTAIHPRQIEVIRRAFQPTTEEIECAEEVLAVLAAGPGAAVLADGRMVDAAMAVEARRILARTDRENGS